MENFKSRKFPKTQIFIVEKVNELAKELKVDENATENLQLGALFHDSGFIKGAENHEEESVKILTHFLKEKNVETNRIEEISKLILATKIGRQPENDLEKIIVVADCAHLGNKSFEEKTELLRKEWENLGKKKFSDAEWISINIDFLTNNHKYHTDYALKKWSKGKEKNLAKLLKSQNKLAEESKKFKQKKEAERVGLVSGVPATSNSYPCRFPELIRLNQQL